MATNVRDTMKGLSPARRKKIEAVTELETVLKERQQVWQVVLKRGNQTVRLQLAG